MLEEQTSSIDLNTKTLADGMTVTKKFCKLKTDSKYAHDEHFVAAQEAYTTISN